MTIPMCWKCSSSEMKQFIMSGVTVFHMVGCQECDAKSYEEARTMCPLINSDLIDLDKIMEEEGMADIEVDEIKVNGEVRYESK